MKEDIYATPASNVSPENSGRKHGFFRRCWRGEIKLWQAFWLVHVFGFVFCMLVAIGVEALFLKFLEIRAPNFLGAMIIGSYGVFAVVALWRNSPNPKVSIPGALVKLWAMLFSIYVVAVCIGILGGLRIS